MRRHRRSGWGDITVDSASYLNGVLYSKRKASALHAPNPKKVLGTAFSWLKIVFRMAVVPLGILAELARSVIAGLSARRKTPARTRLATRELKRPTVRKPVENITVGLNLGKSAAIRAVEASTDGSRRREILFGAACLVLCVLSLAIAPALAAPPQGSTTFTFNDNGRAISVVSTAGSVEEFLKENDVELSSGDEINVDKNAEIRSGMVVSIDRAVPVTIVSGGHKIEAGIQEGTVADALKSAGITPDENDRVSPSLDTNVRAGMKITHTVVEATYISKTEVVPYKTVYKKTAALAKDKEQVETYGVAGKVSHKIRINYENGKETSRYEIETTVVREARDEVVLQGTKVAAADSSSKAPNTSRSVPAAASSGTSGSSGSTKVSGGLSSSSIKKTLRLNATAYTYTGHRTATGTNPRRGTVAVNPSVIPYGTRLYIEGYGYGVAEDTGSFIYSFPNRIDLFMESLGQCYSWGSRTVTVHILK